MMRRGKGIRRGRLLVEVMTVVMRVVMVMHPRVQTLHHDLGLDAHIGRMHRPELRRRASSHMLRMWLVLLLRLLLSERPGVWRWWARV